MVSNISLLSYAYAKMCWCISLKMAKHSDVYVNPLMPSNADAPSCAMVNTSTVLVCNSRDNFSMSLVFALICSMCMVCVPFASTITLSLYHTTMMLSSACVHVFTNNDTLRSSVQAQYNINTYAFKCQIVLYYILITHHAPTDYKTITWVRFARSVANACRRRLARSPSPALRRACGGRRSIAQWCANDTQSLAQWSIVILVARLPRW